MSHDDHTSDHGSVGLSDDRARAVDEAGRRAGAALRSPAPAHGAAAIQRRAQRRRAVRVAAATAGVGVLVVAGLSAVRAGDGSGELQAVDTSAVTSPTTPDAITPVSTAVPSTIETMSTVSPVPTGPVDFVEVGSLSGSPWPRYSADGSLLAIESSDGNVAIHDAATLTQLRELPCPTSVESLPDSAGTAPSRDRLWVAEAAASWDADALTVLTSASRPQMCGVTVSADGSRAVTDADVQGGGEPYGRSLLWDTSDGSLVAVIPGLLSGFSADGSTLVVSTGPGLSIVDSSTGAVLNTVTDGAVGTVASPDGSRLLRSGATTAPDGTSVVATIYDTQTLTPVATLSADLPDGVATIEDPVFDDQNDRVAALVGSGLTIWDASTGAELGHVAIELVDGRSAAFSPGGAIIAVRNGSHILVIDSSSGVQLADLYVGPDSVEELVFSPDSVALAAGVTSGARVWSYRRDTTAAPPLTTTTTAAPPAATSAVPPQPAPGQEISVSNDVIEVGQNLSVPADRLAADDGVVYVLANQLDQPDGAFSVFEETAVLAAFDDAGVERWRIELDRTPSDVVVVDGDPWVLQGAWTSQDEPTVTRISAADGRILGDVTLDVFAASAWLVGAHGAVWIAAQQESFSDPPHLVRIDPDLSTTRIDLPDNVLQAGCDSCRGARVAAGADALWVPLGDGGVARVDPDTNQVTVIERDEIGHAVYDVAVDGDVVYVASFDRVTSIVDGRMLASASVGPIAYLGPLDGVFGVLRDDGQFQTLTADDPMEVERREISPDGRTYGLAATDGEAWIEKLVERGSWQLHRLQLVPLPDDEG